jgi:hypothetical protein
MTSHMDVSFFDLHYAVKPESLIPIPSTILLSFGSGIFRDSVSADQPSGPSLGGEILPLREAAISFGGVAIFGGS